MGLFNKLMSIFSAKQKAKVIVVGLDGAGKSTLLRSIMYEGQNDDGQSVPTVGFVVETVNKGKIQFSMFDMSGQGKYRSIWEEFYSDVDGIIFVIDSTDHIRACVAKDELQTLLSHKDITGSRLPLLFFANKKDLEDAMGPAQLSDALQLHSALIDHPWHITASDALTGSGVEDGLQWLCDQLKE